VSYLPHSPELNELHDALVTQSRQEQLEKAQALRDR